MRKRLCALALVVAAVAAPGLARTSTPSLTRAMHDAGWAGPGSVPYAPLGALRDALRAHDARAIVDAQTRVLTTPRSRGGGGLFRLDASTDIKPGDPWYRTVYPGGDLDGDGNDDVLEIQTFFYDDSLTGYPKTYQDGILYARSGADGHVLWSRPARDFWQGLYLVLTVPGTPVGIPGNDVVTIDMQEVGGVRDSVLQQTVSVINGRTGALRWSHEFDALLVADTPEATAFLGGAGVVTGITPMTDSLLVTTLDWTITIEGGVARGSGYVLGSQNGDVLGVATAASAVAHQSWLFPVPEVFPGRAPGAEASLFTISTIQGAAVVSNVPIGPGAPFWTAVMPSISPSPNLVSLPPVVTGNRVLVVRTSDDIGHPASEADVLSNTDGTSLWSQSFAALADAAGDVDGDGLADVRLIGYDLFKDQRSATISSVSGADGSILWWSSFRSPDPPADGYSILFPCICADDLNGDGATETLLYEETAGTHGIVSLDSWAVNGRDGSVLWRTAPLDSLLQVPIPARADLTGDGPHDVWAVDGSSTGPGEVTLRFVIRSGADGLVAWQAGVAVHPLSGRYTIIVWFVPMRLDSTPGFVVGLNQIAAVRGSDGRTGLGFQADVVCFDLAGIRWSV